MMRLIRVFIGLLGFVVAGSAGAQPHTAPVAARTANPHGPDLKTPCATCHAPTGWKPARIARSFRHADAFPLSGAHATATCASCHASLDFKRASATCATCHEDVHKGEVGRDCARCHSSRAFIDRSAMTRMHQLTRFPLRAAHAVVACESCHLPTRSGQMQFVRGQAQCASCHMATFRAAAAPPHVQPSFSADCTSCHKTSTWKGATFDHALTLFPLTGGHRTVGCAECHADKQYHGRSMECSSCHQKDFARTTNPPHAQGFPTTCLSCHTTDRWQGATFDHAQRTTFPLTGSHRTATCAGCHGDGVFRGKPATCVTCHQAAYNGTTTPKHAAAGFATTCESCHGTTQWKGAVFDHNTSTRFVLSGAHRTATCASCHGDDVYRGKPTTCVSCHQAAFTATREPPHVAANLPTTCQSCHTTSQWKGASFDHTVTAFPLTGAHRAATCQTCHADKVYVGKSTACASCHQAAFDATTNPNHRTSGFSVTCQSCHTTTQWRGAVFNHDLTRFPLTGAHRASTCQQCHADNVFAGKPTACASCHQADYDGTTTPNHRAANFPTLCQSCHTTTQWLGAPFDHATTQFPLTGAHRASPCTSCHADGVYDGKPTTCVSCHQSDYNGTTTPNHRTLGFPTGCEGCHTTTQWTGASFNHDATAFPLTGAHRATTCTGCHADGVFKGKPTACASCHQGDYSGTTRPPHGPSNISLLCQSCHTTTQWAGAPYNHAATAFPLTGAHLTATCQDCHADGVYRGKPQTCVTCHDGDWSATTNPHHAAAGFVTQCQNCHSTTRWQGGTYNHSATAFPLTGAHIPTPCISCHANKVYKGLPATCVSCHLTDYNTTTNPAHGAASLPTTCQSCHTTTQWTGATFNHDGAWFPIYSGKHRGKWTRCSDCHTNPGNYKVFTCFTCHPHSDKAKTDGDHRGRSGYAYDPIKCYACHPKGD